MCDDCGWSELIEQCDLALDMLEDLPEHLPSRTAMFKASVEQNVRGIQAWVEDHRHATKSQRQAVRNMIQGVQKCLDRLQ